MHNGSLTIPAITAFQCVNVSIHSSFHLTNATKPAQSSFHLLVVAYVGKKFPIPICIYIYIYRVIEKDASQAIFISL